MVIGLLETPNYTGTSVGAIHWYSRLWIENLETNANRTQLIRVERKLTGKEIIALNEEAGYRAFGPGATTEGFMNEENAVAAGLQRFKSQYKGVLFHGSMISRSPWKTVLYCTDPHMKPIAKRMNLIATQFQALKGYEGAQKKLAERLDNKWGRLYNTLRLMCKP